MANEQNLTAPPIRSTEEAQRKGRNGGKASGAARRRKKTMREWAAIFGETPVKLRLPDGREVDTTLLGQIVAAQMQKASKGDTKAAQYVSALLEETANVADGVTIIVRNTGEAKKIEDIADLGV